MYIILSKDHIRYTYKTLIYETNHHYLLESVVGQIVSFDITSKQCNQPLGFCLDHPYWLHIWLMQPLSHKSKRATWHRYQYRFCCRPCNIDASLWQMAHCPNWNLIDLKFGSYFFHLKHRKFNFHIILGFLTMKFSIE